MRVEWISRYPEGGGLQSDLEALERMTADPANAAETLVSLCPVVFRSHWSLLLVEVGSATRGSPTPPPWLPTSTRRHGGELLAPFDPTHRIDLASGWLPGLGRLDGGGRPR